MDEVLKAVATALLSYGLPGIVILGLCGLIWLQRKDNRELRDDLLESYEERRKDALAWQEVVRDNTAAMNKVGESVVAKVQVIEQTVSAQAQSMRDLVAEVRELRFIRRPRDPPGD